MFDGKSACPSDKSRNGAIMCCRYYFSENEPAFKEALAKALASSLRERFIKEYARPVITEGEVRPTDIVPVVASNRNGERSAFPMKWGFTMPGSKNVIVNARVESAAEKPMFREAWQRRRCMIPASWYYEWQHFRLPDGRTRTGEKYAVQPKDSDITWLAGLYRMEETNGFRYPVFVVLTREPCGTVRDIHDRMPVILPESAVDDWIAPGAEPGKVAARALTELVVETADKRLSE